ncbi:conjugal transfer protein TraH (plasmid) [Mesorhizobium sp. NBSH29]|uniref:TraH family protein n=1 Tax=Mesorhizobium sp. NBSH29 TaxID=2654249 RepID=UPI00189661F1|nr:TraH family protein [Mesorhizobium sp. NBSH29]QPC88922.1 conjugal transfer protein TraH [Mesorhizobium sp. NBSH29]
MIDAALIQQCADPGLKPAIVEKFIAEAGSSDPLAVTVRAGDRVVLVPKPRTPEEAMALVRQHIGKAVVRVGVTQYPAGLGVADASELKTDLVDACANIRVGTALFGKVYRAVTKWYGNAVDEAFEDAILAWKSGYFEGRAVFEEPDPGEMRLAEPKQALSGPSEEDRSAEATPGGEYSQHDTEPGDPDKAGIRIDLSRIGARFP